MLTCFDFLVLEFSIQPQIIRNDNKQIKYRDCKFKFHRLLNTSATFAVFDSNMSFVKEIPTIIEHLNNDTYRLPSFKVEYYADMGTYIQCRIYNSTIFSRMVSSSISEAFQITRKFLCSFCL